MNQVQPQEAHAVAGSGHAVILDVRGHDERAYGFIPGSLHIPLHELPQRHQELPKDKVIVCQCASGGRSMSATRFLEQAGFRASNLVGGIGHWHMTGLPVVRGDP